MLRFGLMAMLAMAGEGASGRFEDLSAPGPPRTITAGGATARVEVVICGTRRPSPCLGEGDYYRVRYVVATVAAPHRAPVTITSAPADAFRVGLGRLGAPGDPPGLIVIAASGGSAGCVTIDMALPGLRRYRAVRAARRAGETQFCYGDGIDISWPTDLTGNGRPDFVMRDDLGAPFSSSAGRWSPPLVLEFAGDQLVDVSRHPRVAHLFRADMVRARRACETAVERNGACLGYAADAARLGRLDEVWPIIARGHRPIGRDFRAAVEALLRRHGYLGERKPAISRRSGE